MAANALLLALLEEGYSKKTWHGPNLKQSLKGISAKQAAWRPGHGRHNIWKASQAKKRLPMLYGVAFHDVYHAGQIRLLRRLMEG